MSDRAELQARLDAGEWLTPGEAAALLDAGRTTVHRMLDAGTLAYRVKPGSGGHREVDPESLRAELARRAVVHRGPGTAEDPAPGDQPGTGSAGE